MSEKDHRDQLLDLIEASLASIGNDMHQTATGLRVRVHTLRHCIEQCRKEPAVIQVYLKDEARAGTSA